MNAGFEYREEVGPEAAGHSVISWLASRYRHSSETAWRDRLAAGEVTIDGEVAVATDVLRPGQSLAWRRPPWEEPSAPLSFAVLYRDEHLLAVAKPRGLPSVPAGGFLEHTLLRRVQRLHPEAVPVHRLGRGTSGLVLFARTDAARRHVAAEWRARRVEKTYRALATGVVSVDALTIDARIGLVPHPRLGLVHAASPAGREAVSHVRVLARRGEATLVEVVIPTGRAHQIRIHLAAAGHPLVGDPLYVAGGVPGPRPALPGEGGYRLHAHRVVLAHPLDRRRLVLECSPPPDLRA